MRAAQRLPDWDRLHSVIPDIVTPMRRYLDQLACILRPGSVSGADQALRSLAAFLTEQAPDITFLADIRRHHIEDFRTWLTARPGRRTNRLTPATLAHRLGTLRMFFVRISDWDWPEAHPGCRSSRPTCPARTTHCPRPSTTRPQQNCCAPPRPSPACSSAWRWKCCCAPVCGSASSRRCKPTRSCSSAPRTGYTSPSASSTTTATFPCTHTSSPSSTTTAAPTWHRTTRCCCPGRMAMPWTGTPSPA